MKCTDCRKLCETMRLIPETGEVYTRIMEAVNDLNDPKNADQREQLLDYIQSKIECYDTVVLLHDSENDQQTG